MDGVNVVMLAHILVGGGWVKIGYNEKGAILQMPVHLH